MKPLILTLLLFLFSIALSAETLHFDYHFEQPRIEHVSGRSLVQISGLTGTGEPGFPSLPAFAVKILLDPSHTIADINVVGDVELIPLSAPIFPAQQQYPASMLEEITPAFTAMSHDVNDMPVYPLERFDSITYGTFRGFRIATFLIYPARYLPAQDVLEFAPILHITVETAVDNNVCDVFVRKDDRTLQALSRMVENPEASSCYQASSRRSDRDEYDYLIITPDSLAEAFSLLAEYKSNHGFATEIATVEDILESTEGIDAQDKIRNYIINEYEECGISYLLLGADDEFLPHRGFWLRVGGIIEPDLACDLYYFNLDGTWDDDGNGVYGERHEIDYFSEVYGARASVDTVEEAENFVNKQIVYQSAPVVDDIKRTLLAAGYLGMAVTGADHMEEIRLGCDLYDYSTAGIPDHIEVSTLYDTDGNWGSEEILQYMNGGINMVGHIGHSFTHQVMHIEVADVNAENITNDGVNHIFNIIYTQGCYANAFDNATSVGNYSECDAISEYLTGFENGCVCFIGNTRYGLLSSSNTNGASQHLQREFFDALYGEGITCISEAQTDSRDDSVPFIANGNYVLWVYYEITLLGDPTLEIWTDEPSGIDTNDDAICNTGNHLQIHPNPFNPETTISFTIPADEHVALDIFNIRGQKVCSLLDEKLVQGQHSVRWSGVNDAGRQVSSGIYFSRLKTGDATTLRKMLMLK